MSTDRGPSGLPQSQHGVAARAAGLIAEAEDLAGEFSLRPLLERILRRCTELQRYGVAAINVVNDLTLEAVLAAAVEQRSPVIVQTSVKTVRAIGIDLLFAMWQQLTAGIEVPVSLHLDHCPDRAFISSCTFLKKVAVVITSRIGGTSGPIWGTAFLRAGATAGSADRLEPVQIVAMLRASIEGIKARGKSDVGDKTLLDALVPTVGTIEEQVSAGHDTATTLRAAAATAREHAEATRSMQAMRGRASYTGERSIGTLDAGAIAVAVMFEALADEWPKRQS